MLSDRPIKMTYLKSAGEFPLYRQMGVSPLPTHFHLSIWRDEDSENVQRLFHALSNEPWPEQTLHFSLDLYVDVFTVHVAEMLATLLTHKNNLTSLSLKIVSPPFKIMEEGAGIILMRVLQSEYCPREIEFNLENQGIGDKIIDAFADALLSEHCPHTITMNLNRNRLRDREIVLLRDAFNHPAFRTSLKLKLADNDYYIPNVKMDLDIAFALVFINQSTDSLMKDVFLNVLMNTIYITELELDRNKNITGDRAADFAYACKRNQLIKTHPDFGFFIKASSHQHGLFQTSSPLSPQHVFAPPAPLKALAAYTVFKEKQDRESLSQEVKKYIAQLDDIEAQLTSALPKKAL